MPIVKTGMNTYSGASVVVSCCLYRCTGLPRLQQIRLESPQLLVDILMARDRRETIENWFVTSLLLTAAVSKLYASINDDV